MNTAQERRRSVYTVHLYREFSSECHINPHHADKEAAQQLAEIQELVAVSVRNLGYGSTFGYADSLQQMLLTKWNFTFWSLSSVKWDPLDGSLSRLLEIARRAGNSPTASQLYEAVHELDGMTNGNSAAALGLITSIRDKGIDNPLLANSDHYYNACGSVQSTTLGGLQVAKVLFFNVGYSTLKAIGYPVPQDSEFPPSPLTFEQWMSGNYGAADGLLPSSPSH